MAIEEKISKLVKEELDTQLEDMREQLPGVSSRIGTIEGKRNKQSRVPQSPTARWSS